MSKTEVNATRLMNEAVKKAALERAGYYPSYVEWPL